MKLIMLLSIPLLIFASSETLYKGETLSTSEHIFLHGSSNYRPSIRLKNKRKIHKLHKVDEAQAKAIARGETKEEVVSLRLTHVNKYLIYKVTTEGYFLIINALDGSVVNGGVKFGRISA